MFADEILGPIKQWGILVRDLDQSMTSWVEQLGIGPWWGYRNVPVTALVDGEENPIVLSVGLAYHQGVQIEMIHQLDDANSPYQFFYRDSDNSQLLQHAAYVVPDVEAAVAQCIQRGMSETGRINTGPDMTYVYLSSPALSGIAIELLPRDPHFLDEFARCSAEAEQWDGSDPYRLISL